MFVVLDGRHAVGSEQAERLALNRGYTGVIQQFRLQRLGERLAARGSLQIVYWYPGFSYDRVRLVLEDRTVLRLKLYWPCRQPLGTLWSIVWRPGDGWHVEAGTVTGERVELRAFVASVS